MNEYKIKRDKKGKFTKRTPILLGFFSLIFVLMGILYGLKLVVDWGNTHQIIVQWPVLVEIQPVIVIEDIEPEIIFPVVTSIELENLGSTEQKILDTFGELDFSVMRAIAVCESGLNEEAINWETRDVGLYQINWPIWETGVKRQFNYTLKDMLDEDKNIEVAKWIFDDHGAGEWVAAGTQCFREEL